MTRKLSHLWSRGRSPSPSSPAHACARLYLLSRCLTLAHPHGAGTARQPRFERGCGHRSGAPDGRIGASHRDQGVRQGLAAREPTGRRRLGAGAPPAQPLVPFACSSPSTQRAHTRPDRLHSAALDLTRPGPSPLPCLLILDTLHACTARSSAQLESVMVALASVDPSTPITLPLVGDLST